MSKRLFSIEFFPPRSPEGVTKLDEAANRLSSAEPSFASVTFGAGGSAQDGTLSALDQLQKVGLQVAPHLSCVGSSRASIAAMLQQYQARGVKRIVALRGDLPSGWGDIGELRHASDLVGFIREQTGKAFHIETAAYPEMHPQARSPAADMQHFVTKMRAGADSAITQYFFNADAYFRFVDAAAKAGVDAPIVPGIMPITNYQQLARFSDACGAELPRWLRLRLAHFGDDLPALRQFGLDVVTQLCDRLLAGGAPGLHFYTLNQAAPTLEIWRRLGLWK